MGIEKITCCYNSFTAYFIQYTLLICGVIGFIFNIIGLAGIKWKYIPGGVQFIYIICLFIYLLSIVCISIIILYRRNKTINKENNKISKKISIANLILGSIGILFSIICLIVCWIKYEDSKIKSNISVWNKIIMFVCLGLNLRIMLFNILLWISILLRLIKKTNGAYIKNENQSVVNTSTMSDNREVKVSYGNRDLSLK